MDDYKNNESYRKLNEFSNHIRKMMLPLMQSTKIILESNNETLSNISNQMKDIIAVSPVQDFQLQMQYIMEPFHKIVIDNASSQIFMLDNYLSDLTDIITKNTLLFSNDFSFMTEKFSKLIDIAQSYGVFYDDDEIIVSDELAETYNDCIETIEEYIPKHVKDILKPIECGKQISLGKILRKVWSVISTIFVISGWLKDMLPDSQLEEIIKQNQKIIEMQSENIENQSENQKEEIRLLKEEKELLKQILECINDINDFSQDTVIGSLSGNNVTGEIEDVALSNDNLIENSVDITDSETNNE